MLLAVIQVKLMAKHALTLNKQWQSDVCTLYSSTHLFAVCTITDVVQHVPTCMRVYMCAACMCVCAARVHEQHMCMYVYMQPYMHVDDYAAWVHVCLCAAYMHM